MILLVLSLILFLIVLFSIKRGADFFSPARVFSLVWIVALGLAELKFSRSQFQWDYFGYAVVVIPIISLLIGVFISYIINFNKVRLNISEIRAKVSETHFNVKKFYKGILIFFVAYSLSQLTAFSLLGYVPLFAKNFEQARVEYGVFGISIIIDAGWLLMFLCLEFLTITTRGRVKPIYRRVVILILIVTFLSYLTMLQRYPLMVLIFMSSCFLFYGSYLYKPKWILSLLSFLYLLFQAIHSIRVSQYVNAYHYVISNMRYDIKYAAFTEPYMYIAMNLENTAWASRKIEFYTLGLRSFDWLLAITQLKHPLIEYFSLNQQMHKVAAYNTFTFSYFYYSDFGVFGITIVPLFLGLIISYIYGKMIQTGEINWIVAYSVCFFWMAISFFTNPLISLNIIVAISILWYFHKFIQIKPI